MAEENSGNRKRDAWEKNDNLQNRSHINNEMDLCGYKS